VVWVGGVLSSSAMIVSSVVACGSGDSVGEVVACSVEPEGVLLAPCWPHPNEETSTTAAVIAAKMADRYHLGTILRYSPECVEGEFSEIGDPRCPRRCRMDNGAWVQAPTYSRRRTGGHARLQDA
jgi:hypothetical protein